MTSQQKKESSDSKIRDGAGRCRASGIDLTASLGSNTLRSFAVF